MARDAEVATLVLAGLLLLVGGLTHPALPGDEGAQAEALPGETFWRPSHWVLTVGQALAAAGLVGLARRTHHPTPVRTGLLWLGTTLAATGFLVGVLGTLTAATALVEAARQDPGTFAVVNEGALGLGRLCMLLVGLGAIPLGASFAPESRWFGGGVAVAGLLALAASLAFPTHHPWFHDGVLRFGVLAGGVALLAAGGAVRAEAHHRPGAP